MECQHRVQSLIVLTLLQLCQAEIKDAQPQWYSANIINDGFQPKSISDIFPTEATFSTVNPIIVSSNSDDIRLSTLPPPTSLSSTFETSATFPSSSKSNQLSSFSPSQAPIPQYSSSAPPIPQYIPSMNQNQHTVEIQQPTSSTDFETMQPVSLLKMITELQAQPQRNVEIQREQSTTQSLTQSPTEPTAFFQPQPIETVLPQDIRYELVQNGQTNIGPESSSVPPQNIPLQPNYFLIYQQAPQSVQSYPNPSSSPRTTAGDESFTRTTTRSPMTSTLSSTFSSPIPTFSTTSSPVTEHTSPLFVSTIRPPSTQYLSSSTPRRVAITTLSTIGSSSNTDSNTRIVNCVPSQSTTPLPKLDGRQQIPINQIFPLKIRVIAPSGSITNVNFNPAIKHPISSTTQKSTTTRKPTTRKLTTRRTQKPRKNTYERCLQGCRKNGQPLCAAPISQYPVDPKTLRGFPSVCHMACHNSYRKDAFEKLIDGSCSKLRTRIRPVDSNSKLKREELQKVQYFLDDSSQQPVFEFTGVYS